MGMPGARAGAARRWLNGNTTGRSDKKGFAFPVELRGRQTALSIRRIRRSVRGGKVYPSILRVDEVGMLFSCPGPR